MSAITQIQELLEQSDYSAVRELCQQILATQPCDYAYWYWGLAELLHGNPETAQEIWVEGMSVYDSDPLITILTQTAKRLEETEVYHQVQALYFTLYDLCPENLNYLLLAIYCGIKANTLSLESYQELGLIEKLQDTNNCVTIDYENVTKLIRSIARSTLVEQLPEIVYYCYQHISDLEAYINFLTDEVAYLSNSHLTRKIGIQIIEQCLMWQPNSLAVLSRAAYMYVQDYQYAKSEIYANRALELATSLLDRICATYYCLMGIANSGHQHSKMQELILKQLANMQEFIAKPPDLNLFHIPQVFIALFHYPYVFDQPRENHQIQNGISKYCEERVLHRRKDFYHSIQTKIKLRKLPDRPLKIGYLSRCFFLHSVGILAQSLFLHHDRQRYKIHIYAFDHPQPSGVDFMQEWYRLNTDKSFWSGDMPYHEVARVISEDEVDILIDLDGVTSSSISLVLPLKPAPIQATWLGWDATGLPSVDYFIADPYVLPENAQEYYTETIWRLPRTYIAVNGFQVGIPDQRRDQLGIPSSAIVYLSSQKGDKRNPNNLRLQMEVVKAVKGSYLILKGLCEQEKFQEFVLGIADQVGLNPDQLKFLPVSPTVIGHRANLYLADVVLDTYPYNGATTTLEVLWMNIPIVTRVGEQFFARYTYTMLKNIGVEEGIAWNDAEYVEWGIRLGTDHELREQVARKIRQSKHWAPLWNAKQFARDMENAFDQMWQKYLASRG